MSTLHQYRWPALAQDLAILYCPGSPIESLDEIYKGYDINEKELKALLKIPVFQELYKNALAKFKAQGTRAGQMYRAVSLAQNLTEKLYQDALDDKVEPKEALKLLELLMRSGGVLDAPQGSPTVNIQNNVGVQLPLPRGLRKLSHLEQKAVEA